MSSCGIVLHVIPYNDRYDIIHLYTDTCGRVACLAARGRGRRNALSRALFIPLSVLEIDIDRRFGREFYRIRECRPAFPTTTLSTHPTKNMLSLFLAELLYRILREDQPDPPLFDYLHRSIHILENTTQGIANFHLVFLPGLLRYFGVFPHVETFQSGYWFDMSNAVFVPLIPAHPYYLNQDESQILSRLLRLNYENMSLHTFTRLERSQILHRILQYYRLHLPSFPALRSLPILQSLFPPHVQPL